MTFRCGTVSALAVVIIGLALVPARADTYPAPEKLKDWKPAPPVNALGPIAPNGTWKPDGAGLTAAADPAVLRAWTIQTAGDTSWTDYMLSATVTIRKAAPKADFQIIAAEFDRYLPREMFPPLCQHTGQYRYRYYAGEFDWGSEAALLVRYQDRENGYRVQLSSEYQELILWHGTGGYLQVVPCKLKVGQTYAVKVLAQGANIQILVDGVKKIDYWHRTLPTLAGKAGLGAYRSTVAFGDVTVTPLSPAETAAPPHKAAFATRRWRTLRWIFDGNEPICLMEKTPKRKDPPSGRIYYHQVKLVPGYRPSYFCWVGVQPGYGASMTWLLGDEDTIKTDGEGTGKLTLKIESEDRDKYVHATTTDRLTFDAVRGTYRHSFRTDVEFLKDRTIGTFEFFDPLTYNNKEPGRGVKNRWMPAGHLWGILRGTDGKVYRHPVSQTLALYRQNNWHLPGGKHLWMLYPDRAACPAWEHNLPGQTLEMGVCHWGYDWHQRVRYLSHKGQRRDFKTGERVTFRHVATAYPPAEAEKLYMASTLHPMHEKLGTLDHYSEKVRKRIEPSTVRDGFAIPICDPAGTDFTRLGSIREPFTGWPWRGLFTLDRSVGHNDTFSLRLDGPAETNGLIYHHMLDPAKRYLCTFWVKTQGTGNKGPIIKLKYSYRDTPCDLVETGLTGDNDWQKISFVTTVPIITFETYDSSSIELSLEGEGKFWLDDFSIIPLGDDEKATDELPPTTKLTRTPFAKKK